MKSWKIICLLSLIVSLMAFTACMEDDEGDDEGGGKTDPCKDVTCGDNASCDNGNCVCDDGYTGDPDTGCTDPCEGVTCGANASCANGDCVCDTGYSGDPDTGCTKDITGADVGLACTVNTDCATETCLTEEFLASLFDGEVIPVVNGYCSLIGCTVDGSDPNDLCTEEVNGICISLYPFMGEDFADLGLCLSPCVDDNDCRTEDSNGCFDPQIFVDHDPQLMTQADVDLYFGDLKACLPNDLIAAAIAALEEEL